MMELGIALLACAVFAALAAVSVTAALKSARVDDAIGEVFSPWIEDPFGRKSAAETVSDEDGGAKRARG
jgi:hypothetical protein